MGYKPTKFGLGSEGVGNIEVKTFFEGLLDKHDNNSKLKSLIEEAEKNIPSDPASPNYPRVPNRISGYQNPMLGDDGVGGIKRGQMIKLDALENVIDHIIENYLKDREWYSDVRAREALWNMYRRIHWWVEQQTDPAKSQYQRTLLMIQDCIYKILDTGENVVVEDADNPTGSTLKALSPYEFSSDTHWMYGSKGLQASISPGEIATATRTYETLCKGYFVFQFALDIAPRAKAYMKLNGEVVWEYTDQTPGATFAFRDVRIDVPSPGRYVVEWGLDGGDADLLSEMKIDNFDWVGLEPPDRHMGNVPYCPLPYNHFFNADYFNHYEGKVNERPLFKMADLPKLKEFPGFFRYMSTMENQEWELAHSVGGDESQGNENIIKLDMDRLSLTNSSKITFNWRFKREGYISFKYLVSVVRDNGLMFYINNRQVGGAWGETAEWQEVKFYVNAGQTYKFDFLARKRRPERWGQNAIYIKDISIIEVIKEDIFPAPGDYEKHGEIITSDWSVRPSRSAVGTYYDGAPKFIGDNRRVMEQSFFSEADGELMFNFRLGVMEPDPKSTETMFFDLSYKSLVESGETVHGSQLNMVANSGWKIIDAVYTTKAGGARIDFDLTVGNYCTVDMAGKVKVNIPPQQIDHYILVEKDSGISDLTWDFQGINGNKWQVVGDSLVLQDPTKGEGLAVTTIYMEDAGSIEFYVDENLRDSERLQVVVDGKVADVIVKGDGFANYFKIPLTKGYHSVGFNLIDIDIEEPTPYTYSKRPPYDRRDKTWYTPGGNVVELDRRSSCDMDDDKLIYEGSSRFQTYTVTLQPGCSFSFKEKIQFMPFEPPEPEPEEPELIFKEEFNDDEYDDVFDVDSSWSHEDIFHAFGIDNSGDGVIIVKDDPGVHTVELDMEGIGFEMGYVEFQYGAKFGSGHRLKLYADGDCIWKSSSDVLELGGVNVRVEVPPMTETLEWRYYAR